MGNGLFTLILSVLSYLVLVIVLVLYQLKDREQDPRIKKVIWGYVYITAFFFFFSFLFNLSNSIFILVFSTFSLLLSIVLIYSLFINRKTVK
ncbi:hypothetical protein J14TS2_50590 [Bacillus sp. J14TS2]|uniref:hypothetical protein n=1 Tax=Bacillus sp. J14TS2 TaxID=2807188 RepID=UPI001B2764D5|nr:hypothetical protein [Bacillus sp. J14TS2]GIN74584.1 hypothetical protein J14TS2_50590 [Bacillus sp. J14TS2]